MDSIVGAVELAEKHMPQIYFSQKCRHFLSGHLHQSLHSRLGCQAKYCNPLLPFGVLLKMFLWSNVEIDTVTILWLLLFAESQLAWTVINFVIELDNRLELVTEVTLWQKIVSNMKIMYLFNDRKSGFGSSIKHD